MSIVLSRYQVKTAVAIATCAVILGARVAIAHDFWLVPNAFRVAAGATFEVHGQTGTHFPNSESAVPLDRVARARVIGATSSERIEDLSVAGKSLVIRHRPMVPGQYVGVLALASREARTTPDRLKRYIALEGAPELANQYAGAGMFATTDSVTQVTGKFAKTIVAVGDGGPRAFSRTAGDALELVPENDPAGLHVGDSLKVRLLFHGNPAAGVVLHAGAAKLDTATTTNPHTAPDTSVVTNANEIAVIPLNTRGPWNVRVLYAAPVGGISTPGTRWETLFATLAVTVATR